MTRHVTRADGPIAENFQILDTRKHGDSKLPETERDQASGVRYQPEWKTDQTPACTHFHTPLGFESE